MNVGVFLPNWIGDVVMVTPALRALRMRFPRPAKLIGIQRPYVSHVLAGTNWLDETLDYDPRSEDRQQRSLGVLREMRKRRLNTVVLFTASLRSGALAFASGAKQRIGIARNGRGPLLTTRIEEPRENGKRVPTSALDTYLDIVAPLGCRTNSRRLELGTTSADEQAADAVWQRLNWPAGERPIVFNTGGAYGPAKSWPAEYFAELARRLAAQTGRRVLLLCGPAERDVARGIAEQARHPAVCSLADEPLSIGLSKACVRRAELMVTTDSGPRHFAAAFGVPVVTLFGPTHIAWSETYFDRAVHLQHEVDCGPCQQRACPLVHHRCMRELSVDRVEAAVRAQLHQQDQHAA